MQCFLVNVAFLAVALSFFALKCPHNQLGPCFANAVKYIEEEENNLNLSDETDSGHVKGDIVDPMRFVLSNNQWRLHVNNPKSLLLELRADVEDPNRALVELREDYSPATARITPWYAPVSTVYISHKAIEFVAEPFRNPADANEVSQQATTSQQLPEVFDFKEVTTEADYNTFDKTIRKKPGLVYFWIDWQLNKLFVHCKFADKEVNHLIMEVGDLVDETTEAIVKKERTCVSSSKHLNPSEMEICNYLVNFRTDVRGYLYNPYREKLLKELVTVFTRKSCFIKSTDFGAVVKNICLDRSESQISMVITTEEAETAVTKKNPLSKFSCYLEKQDTALRSLTENTVYCVYAGIDNLRLFSKKNRLLFYFSPHHKVTKTLKTWDVLLSRPSAWYKIWDSRGKSQLPTLWTIPDQLKATVETNLKVKKANLPSKHLTAKECLSTLINKQSSSKKHVEQEEANPAKIQKKEKQKSRDTPRAIAVITHIVFSNGRIRFKTLPFVEVTQKSTKPDKYVFTTVHPAEVSGGKYVFSLDVIEIPSVKDVTDTLLDIRQVAYLTMFTLPAYQPHQRLSWFFWLNKELNKLYLRRPDVTDPKMSGKDHLVRDFSLTVKSLLSGDKGHNANPTDEWIKNCLNGKTAPENERDYAQHQYDRYILLTRYALLRDDRKFSIGFVDTPWKTKRINGLETLLQQHECVVEMNQVQRNFFSNKETDFEAVVYFQELSSFVRKKKRYRIAFFYTLLPKGYRCAYCTIYTSKKIVWKKVSGDNSLKRIYVPLNKILMNQYKNSNRWRITLNAK